MLVQKVFRIDSALRTVNMILFVYHLKPIQKVGNLEVTGGGYFRIILLKAIAGVNR